MIDSRDINELHPTLKRGAEELKKRLAEKGYPLGISSTYRDNEAQNALYAKGRTTSGSIVTNAKGGQSIHNYRLAFDVFKNISGQAFNDNNFFMTAGKIWEEMGGEWGGSWKSFVDKPHMQFTNNLTLSQLQNGSKMPDVKMKWESGVVEKPLGDDEMVTTENIKIDGEIVSVQMIRKDGYTYVKSRDIADKLGYAISSEGAMPVFTTK